MMFDDVSDFSRWDDLIDGMKLFFLLELGFVMWVSGIEISSCALSESVRIWIRINYDVSMVLPGVSPQSQWVAPAIQDWNFNIRIRPGQGPISSKLMYSYVDRREIYKFIHHFKEGILKEILFKGRETGLPVGEKKTEAESGYLEIRFLVSFFSLIFWSKKETSIWIRAKDLVFVGSQAHLDICLSFGRLVSSWRTRQCDSNNLTHPSFTSWGGANFESLRWCQKSLIKYVRSITTLSIRFEFKREQYFFRKAWMV